MVVVYKRLEVQQRCKASSILLLTSLRHWWPIFTSPKSVTVMLVTICECWWWYVDVGDWNLVLGTSFECCGCWWPKWPNPSEMWSVWCILICADGYNRIVLGGRPGRLDDYPSISFLWITFIFQIFYLCAFILKWKPHRHLTKMHSRNGSEYIAINNILITIYTRDKMTIKLRW